MQEDFLHFLWETSQFSHKNLKTTRGEPIEVIKPGERNLHAGPDFFNARIRIGKTVWAGNVEIHLRASDWEKHNHSCDKAYENVILHVCRVEDVSLQRQIPTLELKNRIPEAFLENYRQLRSSKLEIPCEKSLDKIRKPDWVSWLDHLMVYRLEEKARAFSKLLQSVDNDWEWALFILLSRSFGFKTNSDPFEWLAREIPPKVWMRERNSLFRMEALLFGVAGLLTQEMEDGYAASLEGEFKYIKKRYGLKPIAPGSWKFLRMRPASFPHVRIAQLAAFLFRNPRLLPALSEGKTREDFFTLFKVQPSAYWTGHVNFRNEAHKAFPVMGNKSVESVLINTVIPFLFTAGKERYRPEWVDTAIELLESLPPEHNAIIVKWEKAGIHPEGSGQTQALYALYNSYCKFLKCTECRIGKAILCGKYS